ncbi:hypothetical protein BDZ94DRAFT_1253323 [Collybia nuda]|uniref:Uncharacterized protein n=1 Tax=Collybia nuda TaxID=64659 RepID=A0A9P5YBA3_9AGAR|nr:hypothetical protein BDZ94DRAFT_1253323 [Collybia nuda]
MTNGPSRLGASFLPSSQTFSPSLKGVNPCVVCSATFLLARSCAAIASSRAFLSSIILCSTLGALVLLKAEGIACSPFQRVSLTKHLEVDLEFLI